MSNYIYSYPPNTKDADGVVLRHSIQVKCPHCGGNHYHNKDTLKILGFMETKAPCGKGHYVIRVKK